jgi:MFS family permease
MFAVAGVIAAMALVAVGNGLMFAYIPVRLGAEGFAPTWAGAILTGLSAGGIVGCFLTTPLIRRVGHARACMAFSALIVMSNAIVALGTFPLLWMAARVLYGVAICGMFIVTQSWLNDVVGNAVRGRVMAIFYVIYIMGLGCGSYLLGRIDIATVQGPLIGMAFGLMSILPIALTRLPQPPRPRAAALDLARAWRISPVAVAGMLAVGGLSMMIAGFAPIHATAIGYSQVEVATLLFAMPLGTLFFQFPLGWISDRTDRRYVLIATALLVMVTGIVASRLDGSALAVMIVIYLIWDGASESIYSLASAHAGDRASREEQVALSSTLLLAWSIGGFIVPGVGTILTGAYGSQTFMLVAIAIAGAYAAFVAWRIAASASR